MIQRIQSVYLLLGVIALGALFFFDSIWGSQAAEMYSWFTPALIGLTVAAGLVGFLAIFLYKNRPRQRLVVVVAQTLTMFLVAALYLGFYLSGELSVSTAGGSFDVGKLFVLFLPVVAYVLYYLARRAIKSDIELVRSMDRLR